MKRSRAVIEPCERRILLAGISGTVFEDRDNNAAYATPDLAVGGATVYLDTNNNGALDAGETSTLTGGLTSGQWGRYTFSGLAVGTYKVRVVPPTNYVQTYPLNNGALSVTLTNPQLTTLSSDIGLRDVTQYSRLSGRVWADTNKNGTREDTETYLANVTVYNDKDDDGTLDAGEESAVTNSNGLFTLDVLNPNYTTTYHVRAVAPAGLTQTSLASTNGVWVQTMNAGNGMLASDQFGFADLTPPQVTSAKVDLDAQPHAIVFNLSEPLGQVPFQLSLGFTVKRTADVNGPTNVTLAPGSFTLSTSTPGVLRYTLNTANVPTGQLPDGVYQATIPANTLKDPAGNTNTSAYSFEFSVLRGDANGDSKVDFSDLVILAQNYGQAGRTFAQGNFDFSADGKADFNDLVLLAQRYGKSLPAASPSMSASALLSNTAVTSKSRKRKEL